MMQKRALSMTSFAVVLTSTSVSFAEPVSADAYSAAVWAEIMRQCPTEAGAYAAVAEYDPREVLKVTYLEDERWADRYLDPNNWPMDQTTLRADTYMFSFVPAFAELLQFGSLLSRKADISDEVFADEYPIQRARTEAALPFARCMMPDDATLAMFANNSLTSGLIDGVRSENCYGILDMFQGFIEAPVGGLTSEERFALIDEITVSHSVTDRDYDTCMEAA